MGFNSAFKGLKFHRVSMVIYVIHNWYINIITYCSLTWYDRRFVLRRTRRYRWNLLLCIWFHDLHRIVSSKQNNICHMTWGWPEVKAETCRQPNKTKKKNKLCCNLYKTPFFAVVLKVQGLKVRPGLVFQTLDLCNSWHFARRMWQYMLNIFQHRCLWHS